MERTASQWTWSCRQCTLRNPLSSSLCVACHAPRAAPGPASSSSSNKSQKNNTKQAPPWTWSCSSCTLVNSSSSRECVACSAPAPKAPRTDTGAASSRFVDLTQNDPIDLDQDDKEDVSFECPWSCGVRCASLAELESHVALHDIEQAERSASNQRAPIPSSSNPFYTSNSNPNNTKPSLSISQSHPHPLASIIEEEPRESPALTRGLCSKLREVLGLTPLRSLVLCSRVEHYASQWSERGFACGYRNAQMILSATLSREDLSKALPFAQPPTRDSLQHLIERAWTAGFDMAGAAQLGQRVVGTRKWIGTAEVSALLSFLRVPVRIFDFRRDEGGEGHSLLKRFIRFYFEERRYAQNLLPLYLQYEGHSITIVGCLERSDGDVSAVVFDPMHKGANLKTKLAASNPTPFLKSFGKNQFPKKEYQIVMIADTGPLSDSQWESAKILKRSLPSEFLLSSLH